MSSTPYDVQEVIVTARPVAGVHADPAQLRTDVYYLLQATGGEAGR